MALAFMAPLSPSLIAYAADPVTEPGPGDEAGQAKEPPLGPEVTPESVYKVLRANDKQLKSLQAAEARANYRYTLSQGNADAMSTDGFTIKYKDKDGEDVEEFIEFDDSVKMRNRLSQRLLPINARTAWDRSKASVLQREYAIYVSARNAVLPLYDAIAREAAAEAGVAAAEENLATVRALYDLGRVLETEVLEADLSLFKATIDLSAAERARSVAENRLSALVGAPRGTHYESVSLTEFIRMPTLMSAGLYETRALSLNADVISIRREIEVNRLTKEAYETFDLHVNDENVAEAYEQLLITLEGNEFLLEKREYEVASDVRQSYDSLRQRQRGIASLNAQLSRARELLSRYEAMLSIHMIGEAALKAQGDAVARIEESVRRARYDYNTAYAEFLIKVGSLSGIPT